MSAPLAAPIASPELYTTISSPIMIRDPGVEAPSLVTTAIEAPCPCSVSFGRSLFWFLLFLSKSIVLNAAYRCPVLPDTLTSTVHVFN
jgi:hypothetical protein